MAGLEHAVRFRSKAGLDNLVRGHRPSMRTVKPRQWERLGLVEKLFFQRSNHLDSLHHSLQATSILLMKKGLD